MEGTYPVVFGGKTVGRVQLQRQGLYWHIICRCQLSGDVVCRLRVRCAGKTENLGVVVPFGDSFSLEKRLPMKQLPSGKPEFQLVPKHDITGGCFVPIYPEEPFAYLSRLKDAYLEKRNGQIGAVFP